MATEKFKKCPKCGEFVPEKITICPCCNSSLKEKTPTSRFIGGFICGIVGFIGIMLIISGIADLKSTDADNSFTNDTKSNVITSIPTTAHDTTPIGNKMALESAKNYLRTMGFQKKDL